MNVVYYNFFVIKKFELLYCLFLSRVLGFLFIGIVIIGFFVDNNVIGVFDIVVVIVYLMFRMLGRK